MSKKINVYYSGLRTSARISSDLWDLARHVSGSSDHDLQRYLVQQLSLMVQPYTDKYTPSGAARVILFAFIRRFVSTPVCSKASFVFQESE